MKVPEIHGFQKNQNEYDMDFLNFTFLVPFWYTKKQHIIPLLNVVGATPFDIVIPCHEIPFKIEETAIKKVFILYTTNKQITHQTVHFKLQWNFPFVYILPNLLPLFFWSSPNNILSSSIPSHPYHDPT